VPNRDTHALVGALVGGGAALAHQRVWRSPLDAFAFGAGSATGGAIGGCLPDVFDPACSPHHRQWGHALAPVGFFTVQTWAAMNQLVEDLLAQAEEEQDPLTRFAAFFVAGLVRGAAPGYLSHIVLDMCTPMGCPLLGRCA
jgi:membrane-bound metal-dependent hydrolase YbcI (DUF457 family)